MSDAATRLCAQCGMCCNGVLFFSARLQAEDEPRKLEKLGLKIKRRADGPHLLQPCVAHTGTRCRVYEHRPARCRLFVCGQLRAVEAGTITETEAAEKIAEAQSRLGRVRRLLLEAGETRAHKALVTRYESVFIEPCEAPAALRDELKVAMSDLESLLQADFRVDEDEKCPS